MPFNAFARKKRLVMQRTQQGQEPCRGFRRGEVHRINFEPGIEDAPELAPVHIEEIDKPDWATWVVCEDLTKVGDSEIDRALQERRTIVNVRRHESHGFIVRNTRVDFLNKKGEVDNSQMGSPITMAMVYTLDGSYIGDLSMANFLCKKRGIRPELAAPGDGICTVGRCEKEGKWYGWSHRAACGFEVGDKIFDEKWKHPDDDGSTDDNGSTRSDKVPFNQHGSEIAASDDDARRSAVAFARSVS